MWEIFLCQKSRLSWGWFLEEVYHLVEAFDQHPENDPHNSVTGILLRMLLNYWIKYVTVTYYPYIKITNIIGG
jgi:hypothetical protein